MASRAQRIRAASDGAQRIFFLVATAIPALTVMVGWIVLHAANVFTPWSFGILSALIVVTAASCVALALRTGRPSRIVIGPKQYWASRLPDPNGYGEPGVAVILSADFTNMTNAPLKILGASLAATKLGDPQMPKTIGPSDTTNVEGSFFVPWPPDKPWKLVSRVVFTDQLGHKHRTEKVDFPLAAS